MSSATLSNVIEKSHDAAANAVADLKPHVENARAALSSRRDDAASAAGSAYDTARRQGRKVAAGAEHYYDVARDYTVDGVRSATRAARGHPLTTVAIAAGVGLLVGAWLMLSRRD
jgi:ElaB/YqjD/DUF883 family membrane-anchored ribosome-binding protein